MPQDRLSTRQVPQCNCCSNTVHLHVTRACAATQLKITDASNTVTPLQMSQCLTCGVTVFSCLLKVLLGLAKCITMACVPWPMEALRCNGDP